VIALLQRVSQAWVEVGSERIAAIGHGLLVLLGVERSDSVREAERLLERVLGFRVFADADGRMNLCLSDTGGGLLRVPQFTLAADTRSGRRPGFSSAATPEEGRRLFDYFAQQAGLRHAGVQTGRFGAEMQVGLVNHGPVTFWLQVTP
jgi:D-tyrosyl-tRNA(Tyr) deacylase